jgi:hypothetical protein
MASARVLWAPYPHRAGFCVTDDTDAATPESVAIVYDFLASIGLRTTKTVWVFEPSEPCGIPALPPSISRGVTLEHAGYLDYVRALHAKGFEISLHGASAGNNVRARTGAALDFLDRQCGRSRTYICHAKNAENPYWHERVAPRGPAQWMLGLTSRYRCSGEDPSSPYFWGDLCLARGLRIRLFRTRNVNTLAENPSMPYHDPEKPLVGAWFSATKRSFANCCSPESIAQLRREYGLCVLYQYMHRYADLERRRVNTEFQAAAERLMEASDVWVETTERIMDRLQMIQGVFAAAQGDRLWLVNANDHDVPGLQVELEGARPAREGLTLEGGVLHLAQLGAGQAVAIPLDRGVHVEHERRIEIDGRGRGRRAVADGEVLVNLDTEAWIVDERLTIEPAHGAARLGERPGHRPLAHASQAERYALLAGQLAMIGREVLWKGRSLDSKKFLGADTIALEDHANW